MGVNSSSSSSRNSNLNNRNSTKQRSFRSLNVSNSPFPMQIKHRERQMVAEVSTRSPMNRPRCNVNRNAKEFSKFWTRGGSLQPSRQSTHRRSSSKRRSHERSVSPFTTDTQNNMQRAHCYAWDSLPCSPSIAATSCSGCERVHSARCMRCCGYIRIGATADRAESFTAGQQRLSAPDHQRSFYAHPSRLTSSSPNHFFTSQTPPLGWQTHQIRRSSHDSTLYSSMPTYDTQQSNRLQCSPNSFHRNHSSNLLLVDTSPRMTRDFSRSTRESSSFRARFA